MLLSKFKMLAALLCIPFIFATQAPANAAERLSVEDLAAAKLELQRQADAEAIAKAFRQCLEDPKLAAIITSAFETQIYSNRPLAFVNGYWAKPINLSLIYAEADLTAALQELLADNPSALQALADAVDAIENGEVIDPSVGAGMVFIPHDVAADQAMMDLVGLTESIAGGAFLDELAGLMDIGTNDFIFTLIIGVGASLIAGTMLSGCGDDDDDRFGPDGDFDHDGIPNKYDADDDNDGKKDTEDEAVFDPSTQITHCPPPGVCFSTVDVVDTDLAEATFGLVTDSLVELTEGGDLMSFQADASVGMLFSFPGVN